jgi:hypothetical protein
MTASKDAALSVAMDRLAQCYSGQELDWSRFYQPKRERTNFGSRYHLVYPALAYYLMLKQEPELADTLRPRLDNMYSGLLQERCWKYWHTEIGEKTWPLQERNLTYAGRLATFVGFYIDAFGDPPADRIELGGRTTTYTELSENLWRQMTASPSCGVSCYDHQSMVMCNGHMLINNTLHDRLFGSHFASANARWLETVDGKLLTSESSGPLFFYGTQPNEAAPYRERTSVGADIWALFLMSAVIPERVARWFDRWQDNIAQEGNRAYIQVATVDAESEFSCNQLATAWAFCLAKELGYDALADQLCNSLKDEVITGFTLDPLLSGLFLLGNRLQTGSFNRLVMGREQIRNARNLGRDSQANSRSSH